MNEPNVTQQTDNQVQISTNPLRSLIGSLISGGLGYLAYSLMIAIATSFATKPIHSDSVVVINIASAVRTLVVGVVALASGVFGIVAVGLLALTVQLFFQQLRKQKT